MSYPNGKDTTCASCKAPVRVLRNDRTGRLAPINPEPDPKGNVVLRESAGFTLYHVLTKDEADSTETRYTSHFFTCPDATKWRAKR